MGAWSAYRPTGRGACGSARSVRAGGRTLGDWQRDASPAARAGDAAQVGEHLPRCVHGQGPCLQADHTVGLIAGQLLGPLVMADGQVALPAGVARVGVSEPLRNGESGLVSGAGGGRVTGVRGQVPARVAVAKRDS